MSHLPSPVRSSRFRRLTALLAGLLAAFAAAPAAASVPETTSIWGYSGLVVMPNAHVHGFRDFSVGAHVLNKGSDVRLAPFATAGVFEGLEFGILYGLPVANFTGLTGHAKYQLIRPTKERPTAVAVGVSLLGVNASERYVDGNNLYLVLSHDFNAQWNGANYTLLSGHFGFAGNLSLGSRLMAGLEVPVTEHGVVFGDFMGPMGTTSGFFNLGLAFRPVTEWQFRLYTMGAPGQPWHDRDFAAGLSYTGNLLGNLAGGAETPRPQPSASPRFWPTPRPSAPSSPAPSRLPQPSPAPSAALPSLPPIPVAPASEAPEPSPSPGAEASPAVPVGEAAVRGALLDDKGRPLAGWVVGVQAAGVSSVSDVQGRFHLSLPFGPHDLVVKDPQGRVALTKAVRLVNARGLDLPLVVSLPVGQLKGTVLDRQSKQGVSDANIQLFRAGETYSLTSRDSGAFAMPDLPAGEYRVVVTRPRYQPYEAVLALAPKQTQNLQIALAPKTGSLSGRVINLKGQGQPGVTVAIGALKQTTTSDRHGNYSFRDLPPGEHEVVYTLGNRRLSTTLVRVRSDETTTENVTMAAEVAPPSNKGGTIGGQIVDAASKRPIAGVKIIVEGGELTVLTLTAADGRFTVSDLPPGRYKVTASRGGYQSKLGAASVTATTGAVVNLALPQGR